MMDPASLAPLATAAVIALVVWGGAYRCLQQSLIRDHRLLSCYISMFIPSLALAFGLGHLAEDMIGQHAGWCASLLILIGMSAMGSLALLGSLGQQQRIDTQGTKFALSSPLFVQQIVAKLAGQLGLTPPQVKILPTQRALAFVVGIRQPKVYVSQWFLDHLTQVELEQVLAHELAHIHRRDNLIALVSTFFLGATFFLPSSWWGFRHLLRERELAADEIAVSLTGKPAALARALVKVVDPEYSQVPIPGFLHRDTLEQRIKNLVRLHQAPSHCSNTRREHMGLVGLILLGPLPLGWLVFDLPHLLNLP